MTEPLKSQNDPAPQVASVPKPLIAVPNPAPPQSPSPAQPLTPPVSAVPPPASPQARPVPSPVAPVGAPKSPAPAVAPPAPHAPIMRPVAGPATMQRRHYGVMISFVVMVLLPILIATVYLFAIARDQYASTTGFTVRQEEGGGASALLGGLSFLAGGTQGVNGDVLYEYVQSQSIVEAVSKRMDLRAHYSAGWPFDPVYSIWPDASIEDLLRLWQRFVRVSYDAATGLFHVEVRAMDPQTAQKLSVLVLEESQAMINRLNETARADSMTLAQRELSEAVDRLRVAREALSTFRAKTRIVDPVADIQSRLGVVGNLQQQLAQSLVELDLLVPTTREDDPRRAQLERRIEVIRGRIDAERNYFSTGSDSTIAGSYPELMADYESLRVDLEFAERNYTASLTALDAARSKADRQSLYLATYIPPTLAYESEYPQRFTLVAIVAGMMLMIWSVVVLVYYSLRDRG